MSNQHIVFTFILLVLAIIFFGITDIDTIFQDKFYNFQLHNWILDRNLEPFKFIFYDGIKKLLILIAVILLIALIFFSKKQLIKDYKKGIYVVLFSAILVPVSVGALKAKTNMPCPKNIVRYEGIYPDTKVWENYPIDFIQEKKIKCWPAGHASGGFALFSLFFLFKNKKAKKIGIYITILIGWSMGLYKMFIGDHFLSHTVITMILSWFIVSLIARFLMAWNPKKVNIYKKMLKYRFN